MTVCNFFLQGRCRYGEKCWNEHPRDERGGDYRGTQQPSRGGYGNRVWINPSQRTGGDYVQPSSFSRDGDNDWSRGGGGADVKSSDFSFSGQNRFSALASHSHSDKDVQSPTDDVDTIQKDMEIWQTSGQWPFSCYSVLPGKLSGFVEVSPEELRLEYYTGRASGDLQAYMNSVQQLADQWRSRVQELRTMSSSTRISVISELNDPSSQTSTHEFGSSASGFGTTSSSSSSSSGFGAGGFGPGSQSSSGFSFAPSKTGFGATNTQHASGFGSGAFAQPPSGFSAPAASAASFSFAGPAADNKSSAAAASSSVSAFSFKPPPGGSSGPADGGGFGQSSTRAADTGLFSAHSDLTAEELKEFTAKRFTLGQIPLKPPPADLLVV
ncbi:nucleoporin NUP42 [Sinocyclocheilus anshuiensis]|uniref:nucleoporin NUP42 n=1 Tax=Sinocyclocheilus anshuiensis TaxID=1608454 RepID=UPI0007B94039|nr:PREDICTED: nucleoporin-like protein 2 [Sinocyclocheilus anshuiensis]